MKKYSDKLKDPRWQKLRLKVFDRDNWQCCECGDDCSTLHVHHLTYKHGKEPWEYEESNFKTLCENCHDKIHKPKKSEKVPEPIFDKKPIIGLGKIKEHNKLKTPSLGVLSKIRKQYEQQTSENNIVPVLKKPQIMGALSRIRQQFKK